MGERSDSDLLSLNRGIPHESILGPLLFSLFINDLPEVTRDVSIHLYADDVQVYLSRPIGLIEDCVARINSDINRIYNWSVENNLKLNPDKSQCIAFSSHSCDSATLPGILLNGTQIPYETKVRDLGLILNSSMKCCDQINANLGKIYATLRRLWLSASILPWRLRCNLVKSLLLPHFTFGCLIFSKLDSTCSRKLNVAFNDCIRFIFSLRRFDHVSHLNSRLLGCSLDVYLNRRRLLFLYSLLHTSQPEYLQDFFVPLNSVRGLKLRLPRFRTLDLERSYTVQVIRIWNSLPGSIQRAGSPSTFRRLVSDFLQ